MGAKRSIVEQITDPVIDTFTGVAKKIVAAPFEAVGGAAKLAIGGIVRGIRAVILNLPIFPK